MSNKTEVKKTKNTKTSNERELAWIKEIIDDVLPKLKQITELRTPQEALEAADKKIDECWDVYDFHRLRLKDLHKIAKEMNLRGYSRLRKRDLADELIGYLQ